MILAFETATDVCSVAFQDKMGDVHEKRIEGKGVHSANVFLFTQALMKEHQFSISDLETVLISNGPGSYTGLRIGVSAIKGLLFGLNTNLYAVNTLAGFAQSQIYNAKDNLIHSVIDARRTHLYHQKFSVLDGLVAESEPSLKEIVDFENELNDGDIVVGTGLNRLENTQSKGIMLFDSQYISATNLIHLFNAQNNAPFFIKTSLEALNPNYITSRQVNNLTA